MHASGNIELLRGQHQTNTSSHSKITVYGAKFASVRNNFQVSGNWPMSFRLWIAWNASGLLLVFKFVWQVSKIMFLFRVGGLWTIWVNELSSVSVDLYLWTLKYGIASIDIHLNLFIRNASDLWGLLFTTPAFGLSRNAEEVRTKLRRFGTRGKNLIAC